MHDYTLLIKMEIPVLTPLVQSIQVCL